MAVSLTPTRGRRRAVDAPINLVPFIDLLSCCIAFLLITAVWSQVARIDVQQPGHSADATSGPPVLTLSIDAAGFDLALADGRHVAVENAALLATLRQHRADREDLIIRATDDVTYERLVLALDAARAAGFTQLAVDHGS